MFLLRDILTSNTTHQEMVETLEVAHRSKNLILGLDSYKNICLHDVKKAVGKNREIEKLQVGNRCWKVKLELESVH